MLSRGELRIDPGELGTDAFSGEMELVVPYTDPELTRAVMRKAVALTAGLKARISLLAVQSMPYPAPFRCPTSAHAFLVDQLTELAGECAVPVNAQVFLASYREDGFRYALRGSTVLVGTYRQFWRTSEERLARMLVLCGHTVALLHIDKGKSNA